MFCGSKKSLISGIAMANVMFSGPALSLIVLPLMIFHQIQLMACAALAHHYASALASASEPQPGVRRCTNARQPVRRKRNSTVAANPARSS